MPLRLSIDPCEIPPDLTQGDRQSVVNARLIAAGFDIHRDMIRRELTDGTLLFFQHDPSPLWRRPA